MKFQNKYSDETKAAVMAALLTGQSAGQVSREYNIPKATILSWKNKPDNENLSTKKELGELIARYLEANLSALIAQAQTFEDATWLRRQEASQLAVLHGVMTDKAIRLLEAITNAKKQAGGE